jgi:hypothetical protein
MYCPELNEPMEVRRILLKNSAWRPKTSHLASADLCARDETLHPVTGLASPGRARSPGHVSQVDRVPLCPGPGRRQNPHPREHPLSSWFRCRGAGGPSFCMTVAASYGARVPRQFTPVPERGVDRTVFELPREGSSGTPRSPRTSWRASSPANRDRSPSHGTWAKSTGGRPVGRYARTPTKGARVNYFAHRRRPHGLLLLLLPALDDGAYEVPGEGRVLRESLFTAPTASAETLRRPPRPARRPPGRDLGNVPPTWPTASPALDTAARAARSASTPTPCCPEGLPGRHP